ncbi:MAG TPA: hypothetical protein DCP69_11810 [Candidatus Omnitrophica bacterium]|nr:hypothetical protein [Candidatus Omnitrophota bacterium]
MPYQITAELGTTTQIPWRSVTVTRVSVGTTGTTALPTTALSFRSGVYLWVPGGGGSLRWGTSTDQTFDASTPLAYAGALTWLPISDAVTLVGQSASGTITVTVIEVRPY